LRNLTIECKEVFWLKEKDQLLVRSGSCIRYTSQTKHLSSELEIEGEMLALEGRKKRVNLECFKINRRVFENEKITLSRQFSGDLESAISFPLTRKIRLLSLMTKFWNSFLSQSLAQKT
jgi:hypothetical protein